MTSTDSLPDADTETLRPYSEMVVKYDEIVSLMETPQAQDLQAEWERLWG